MTALSLIIAPNPIFNLLSEKIASVTDEIRKFMDDLLDTIYHEQGVGIAAPMVGVSKQIIVIDLQENGQKKPLYMANPVIISASTETETYNEGSLSFPGISAPVTRPTEITVEYLDYNNNPQTLIATGFLATCIQHEIDYLYGKTFLSYLSPVKRDMLLRKMQKYKKQGHVPHEHSEYCNH